MGNKKHTTKIRTLTVYATMYDAPHAFELAEKMHECVIVRIVSKKEHTHASMCFVMLVETKRVIKEIRVLSKYARLRTRALAYAIHICSYQSVVGKWRKSWGTPIASRVVMINPTTKRGQGYDKDIPF